MTVAGAAGQWYELDVAAFLRAKLAAGRKVVTLVLRNPGSAISDSTSPEELAGVVQLCQGPPARLD